MDGSWFDRVRGSVQNSWLMRSGLLMVLTVVAVLIACGGLWYEHITGNLHKATTIRIPAARPTGARPGGMEAARLNRASLSTMMPEYLAATVAPGLGMQLLSATINLPTRGEVTILRGSGNDASGNVTDASRGFSATATVAGRVSGHWSEPFSLLNRQPDRVGNAVMPDGGESNATFNGVADDIPAADRGVETRISLTLAAHALELVAIAKNTSQEPRAVTLRWEPRLLIKGGGVTLLPPRLETTNGGATGAPLALGGQPVNVTYTRLKRSYLGSAPFVGLRFGNEGYALRVMAVSPSVEGFHVEAARNADSVLVVTTTNEEDPARSKGEAPGKVLAPGEMLQLHVRIEVTPASSIR